MSGQRWGNVVYHGDGDRATHAETGEPVPLNTWLAAGTRTDDPYPCRCEPGRRGCGALCPCAGRTGVLDHLPGTCCARKGGRG